MMTINFDRRGLAERLRQSQEKIHSQVVDILKYAGRTAVSAQRRAHSYKDQSGNLTSSVGYIVTDSGEEVALDGFDATQGSNPSEGSLSPDLAVEEGKNVAQEVAQSHTDNATLSIVAGMQYASFVADKGYDVLSTGRITAEQIVSEELRDMQL